MTSPEARFWRELENLALNLEYDRQATAAERLRRRMETCCPGCRYCDPGLSDELADDPEAPHCEEEDL